MSSPHACTPRSTFYMFVIMQIVTLLRTIDHQLMEEEELTSPPAQQKMLKVQGAQSLNVEEGTVGLRDVEHLVSLDDEGTSQGNSSSSSSDFDSPKTSAASCNTSSSSTTSGSPEWDELVETFLGDHDQDNDPRHVNCEKICNIVMNHLPFRCK